MKLYYYTLALLSLILIGSCSKDLGNYEYSDINELKITNVSAEYTVRTGLDTLHIKPNISATIDQSDSSRYSFLWILRTGAVTRDTIGYKRNLEYVVHLTPANYELYYRVQDKQTGVVWIANSKIVVSTSYARGLLIMGEDEQGNAEAEMLSMLQNDTVHFKGLLSKSGLPALREPVSFLHTGGYENFSKLWAFTKSGSYYLDRSTLTATTSNNFSRLLYMSETISPETLHPIVLAPQIRTAAGLIGSDLYRAMITVGGDIFAGVALLAGGDYYNNPVNRVATAQEVRLPAAPYLLYPIGSMSNFMWYDTQNQRFLNFASIGVATSSTVLADEGGSIFPWNQPAGRSLVYAENTRNSDGGSTNGNSFAIMKDANNSHHIYKFYANGTNPAKRNYYAVKSIATDFDKAKFYAFSSNRSVVFYAVGNKLYAYDYNPNNEKIYQFPEITDEITMIKFDTQIDHIVNSLYIATYNSSTKGTLQRFNVGSNPNLVELLPQVNSTWTDLVKVKDVNWRAVN